MKITDQFPFLKALIDYAKPKLTILEIGFSGSASTEYLHSKYPSNKHVIVEPHAEKVVEAKKLTKGIDNLEVIQADIKDIFPSLGKFDLILINGFPFEVEENMFLTAEQLKQAQEVLKEIKDFRKEHQKELDVIESYKYEDKDLEAFIEAIPKDKNLQIMRFLLQLQEKHQISSEQYNRLVAKYQFKTKEYRHPLLDFQNDPSSFITFVSESINNHLNAEGKIICYLSRNDSKFNDPQFFEKVIAEEGIQYQEESLNIPVEETQFFQAQVACIEKN